LHLGSLDVIQPDGSLHLGSLDVIQADASS